MSLTYYGFMSKTFTHEISAFRNSSSAKKLAVNYYYQQVLFWRTAANNSRTFQVLHLFSSKHKGCEFLGLNSSIFKNLSSMLWTLWSVTQQSTTSIFLSVVWVSHYLSVSAQNAEVDAEQKNLTYQVASWSNQPFGTRDFHRCQQCRQGAHRPLLGLESMTAYTTECGRHNQSDARPTPTAPAAPGPLTGTKLFWFVTEAEEWTTCPEFLSSLS